MCSNAVLNAAIPLLFILCVTASSTETGVIERSQYHMGTTASILIEGGTNEDADEAFNEIKSLDDILSDYKPESQLSRVNRMAGVSPVRVSDSLIEVLNDAITVARQTDGAFDPSIGALTIGVYRFGRDSGSPRDLEKIAEAKRLVDYRNISISGDQVYLRKKGMMLDLGAIGKGYAVQKASDVLMSRGIKSGIVSLSGDIKVFGRDIEIGIRDPSGAGLFATFRTGTGNLAISTSGGYERSVDIEGRSYHHLLVPGTGEPGSDFLSVTVVMPDNNTLADAYATALYVMGNSKAMEFLKERGDVGVIFIYPDGAIYANRAFYNLVHDLRIM